MCEHEKTQVKQIIATFNFFAGESSYPCFSEPERNEDVVSFIIRNIDVWKCDIGHDFYLSSIEEIINSKTLNFYQETKGIYTIDLYVNSDISSNDLEKIKTKCIEIFKKKIEKEIKFYQDFKEKIEGIE
jgi:hypothetical protein